MIEKGQSVTEARSLQRAAAMERIASGAIRIPVAPSSFAPLPGTTPIPIEKASGCRWTVSSGPDPVMEVSRHVCGARRRLDAVYCDHHESLARGHGTQSERSAERVLRKVAG